MYWPESLRAVKVRPETSPATTTEPQYFQNGNPQTGDKATIVDADFLNMVIDEFINVAEEADITPDKQNNAQLAEAIRKLIASSGVLPSPYGNNGTVLTMVDGSPAWRMVSVPKNKQFFTSSGTFSAPETGYYQVTLVSGGGGGGGGAAHAGSSTVFYVASGGAGASGTMYRTSIFLYKGNSVPVVIGGGGGGGYGIAVGTAASGARGGTTLFGSVQVLGGLGGGGGTANGSAIPGAGGAGVNSGASGIAMTATNGSVISVLGGVCFSGFPLENLIFSKGGSAGGASLTSPGNYYVGTGETGMPGCCLVEW